MDDFLIQIQRASSAKEIETLYRKAGKEISEMDASAIRLLIEEFELLELPYADQDALALGLILTRKIEEILENTDLL